MKKIMYLYEIKNLINGKIYIGFHTTNNLYDGYFGSGRQIKQAIKKYGKENFTKTILAFYDNIDDLINDEKKIVNKEFIDHPLTYNIELGGAGGKIWTKELRNKMSKTQKKRFANGAKSWCKGLTKETDNRLKKAAEKTKGKSRPNLSGERNGMFGIDVSTKMSKEANSIRLKKIKEANKGKIRTEEHRKKYSKAASSRIWLVNIHTGKLSHTTDLNDSRLNDSNWKRRKYE